MKFSVIVATYNQLELLKANLESLQKQTFKDFDVHICDDGSTDTTREFFRQAAAIYHPGFRWYYHWQKNKGNFGANLNQAIGKARGEYFVFMAADSMPELDYLEILDTYAEPHRIVCGVRIQISEIAGKLEGVDVDWRLKKEHVPQFPAPVVGRPWISLTGNGLTVPREAFELYGPWSEAMKGYGGEDTELIARLFFKGYVCWSVPDLRLYHRWHRTRDASPENLKVVNKLVESYVY